MINFNEIEWHDVAIKKFEINRDNPGHFDTISFVLEKDSNLYKLSFHEVYQVTANLNFAVIPVEGKETINYGYSEENNENEFVNKIRCKWNGCLDKTPLKYYEIETNSTYSMYQIVAVSFTYERL